VQVLHELEQPVRQLSLRTRQLLQPWCVRKDMPLRQFLYPRTDFLQLFLVRGCLLRLRLYSLLQVIEASR
jgi:hypothetical protein